MSKTESITAYFKVYIYTSVPEAKPYLDKLTDEPSLLPNNDSDDDYYDGDFDEPPTPDFGMDDWYPNDEW